MSLRILALALLALPGAALADEYDHGGSVGLLVAAGPEFSTTEVADCLACANTAVLSGTSLALDLGGTLAVGQEGGELELRLRLVRLSSAVGESLIAGYRRYFGSEEWKTYFAFGAQATFRPIASGGARAALGVMREITPVLGTFAEGGATFGLGTGRRFGVELVLGLQARSYLLQ